MSQLKERFENIVRESIKRDGVDELMKWLKQSDFYTAPASTKYHGAYEGGLVQHCLDVYECLHDELSFIYGDNYLEVYNDETIAVVSLFHDLCKVGRYKSGTRNVKDPVTKQWHEEPTYFYDDTAMEMGHGAKSVFILQKYMQLSDEEAQAIYWHMGAYDISAYSNLNGLGSAFEKNTLAFALHRADMLATYIVDNENFKPAPLPTVQEEEVEEHTGRAKREEPVKSEPSKNPEPNPEEPEEELENEYSDFNPEDYADWTIDDIKAEIREWGGIPKPRAKRTELLKHLEFLMSEDADNNGVPF